jgi:lipoprotein-releasing system ATP-binding protein
MILQANNIKKAYNNLSILKGANLTVDKGEVVAIVGESGSGKSTLLHILGTLDDADSGELIIQDTNIQSLKENNLAKFRNQHIGFVFQFHNLLPEFTALENVCIPAYLGKSSKEETEERAKQLLERLKIYERRNHKPSELSGGEQQRVAVARAFINSPSIIFADEPSGNLDTKNANKLHDLFFELREELNQTFIIVTHNNDLAHMADRALVIENGLINYQ